VTSAVIPRPVPHPPYLRLTASPAWTTVALTIRNDGSSKAEPSGGSPLPRHYLYDTEGRLTYKSALIRYHDWLRRVDESESPWGGTRATAPMAEVRSAVERQLADLMLSIGSIGQNNLASGALLSSRPIADTEVHSLLDGLIVLEYDGNPGGRSRPRSNLRPVPAHSRGQTARHRPSKNPVSARHAAARPAGQRRSPRRRRTTNRAAA
jgi:hypothetical protein